MGDQKEKPEMSYESEHDISLAVRRATEDDLRENAAVVVYDEGMARLDEVMGKPNPGWSVGRVTDYDLASEDSVIVHHFDTDTSAPVPRENLWVFADV